jgi:hypothetical protein
VVADVSEIPVLVLVAVAALTSLNSTPDVLDYNVRLKVRYTSQPNDEVILIIEPPVARF